jgi:mRNA interferase RelE/StbE
VSYRHKWRPEAKQVLDQLDISVIHAILKRVDWLCSNFENVRPKKLTGRLKDDFTLRVGDYRVIYSINHQDKTLIIRKVGHRSNIYRDK